MKKLVAFMIVLVMTLALAAGCKPAAAPAAEAPAAGGTAAAPAAGTAETIKVGFVGPLTGDAAAWGIAQRNEIQIRIAKVNEAGGLLGKQVELISYDNREDPVETVNAARKLIESDQVVCILGPNNSVCAQAMSSICDDYKVPMICTNTPLEKITLDDSGNVRPYVFRGIMIQTAYIDTVVNWMYDTEGARSAACFYILSNDSNVNSVKLFEEKWKAKGGTITAIETTASVDDTDFRAQLTKIKEGNPDIIFSPFTYKQIILMAQQARELGVTSQFCGCDTWFQVKIPASAGEQVAGCIAIASLDVKNPVLDPIKAEYLEFFGEDQTLKDGGTDPYYGYDVWMMLQNAIEQAGEATPDAIRDALENKTIDVQGCVGKLTVNPETHNPTRELAIVTIDNTSGEYAYRTLGTVYDGVITKVAD